MSDANTESKSESADDAPAEPSAPEASAPDPKNSSEPNGTPHTVTDEEFDRLTKKAMQVFKEILSLYAPEALQESPWGWLEKSTAYRALDVSPADLLDAVLEAIKGDAIKCHGINGEAFETEATKDEPSKETSKANAKLEANAIRNLIKQYLGPLRQWAPVASDEQHYVAFDTEKAEIDIQPHSKLGFPTATTALELAAEYHEPCYEVSPKTLFVVDDETDVRILQYLRLPATTAESLQDLGKDHVRKIFGDGNLSRLWRYHLVLLEFNIFDMKPGANFVPQVLQRLVQLAETYDVDPGQRFSICRPGIREAERLERALTFADPLPIVRTFESWAANAQRVDDRTLSAGLITEKLTISAAKQQLLKAIQTSDNLLRKLAVQRAHPTYMEAVSNDLIMRYYVGADATEEAFQRTLLNIAADLVTTYASADQLVIRAHAILADEVPRPLHELDQKAFKLQLKCLTQLRQIRALCKVQYRRRVEP